MTAAIPTPIPVLLYHAISDDPPSWIAPYTVTPADFARHMDLLVESGCTPLTLGELIAGLDGSLPDRPAVVTFDDGFADFGRAAEIMAERAVTSTLYVTTGALRGRAAVELSLPPAPMLAWSDLAGLRDHGVEIGAHTHTHPQLDAIPLARAVEEIALPKRLLEDHLGTPVTTFAYPHGFSSRTVRAAVRAQGYASAASVRDAFTSVCADRFAVARLMLRATDRPEDVGAWLAGVGAGIAPPRERLRTSAWRWYRRGFAGRSRSGVYAR